MCVRRSSEATRRAERTNKRTAHRIDICAFSFSRIRSCIAIAGLLLLGVPQRHRQNRRGLPYPDRYDAKNSGDTYQLLDLVKTKTQSSKRWMCLVFARTETLTRTRYRKRSKFYYCCYVSCTIANVLAEVRGFTQQLRMFSSVSGNFFCFRRRRLRLLSPSGIIISSTASCTLNQNGRI